MSLNQFIAQVKTRGLARTNRFTLEIPFPSIGEYGVDRDSAVITQLLCESVSMPGMNIATQQARTYGEAREMPNDRTFETFQTTFYVDAEMKVKTAFDKWMALIINPVNRSIGYYKDYVRDITLHIETVDDQRPMSIQIYEAYPKTVAAINLAQDSKEIMKLSVTWQYKYWLSMNNGIAPYTPPSYPGLSATGQGDPQGVNTGTGIPFNPDVDVTEEMIIEREDISGL